MKLLKHLVLATLSCCALLTAQASLITYEFEGVIKNGNFAPFFYFGVDSTFSATAVYDTTAAATYNGPGGIAGQESAFPLVSLSLTVHTIANGDWTATSNSSLRNVAVLNDIAADYVQFSAVGISAAPVAGLTADTFNISFGGANTILNSTAVPSSFSLTDWDPNGFASQTYLKIYLNNFTQSVNFRLTSITASDGSTASVPESGPTLALFGLALLGLARFTRLARTA